MASGLSVLEAYLDTMITLLADSRSNKTSVEDTPLLQISCTQFNLLLSAYPRAVLVELDTTI